jgi:phage baseplate assembly protein gpV
MSSTNRLEFGDTGTYIHQSADGVLDLVSDTEIEINATTIDINGAVDISGTVTVGADGSGTDVIFYSGTAGDNLTWDASDEKLTITGTDGQTALDVADGNVVIADTLTVTGNIYAGNYRGAFTVTQDLDDLKIPGFYRVEAGSSNQPTATIYSLIVYGNGGNVTGQIATHFNTTPTYVRQFNTSWTAWARLDT